MQSLSRQEAGRAATNTLLGANGGTRPVETQTSLVNWGNQPVRQAIIRDISERLAMEQERRVAAEALASIAEGVIIADAGRRVISTNAAHTDLTGFTTQALQGKRLDETRRLPDGGGAAAVDMERRGGGPQLARRSAEQAQRRQQLSGTTEHQRDPQCGKPGGLLRGGIHRHPRGEGQPAAAGTSGAARSTDRSGQPGGVRAVLRRGARGCRARAAGGGGAVHRSGCVQDRQRQLQPCDRRPPADQGGRAHSPAVVRRRRGRPHRRRRVHGADPAAGPARGCARDRQPPAGRRCPSRCWWTTTKSCSAPASAWPAIRWMATMRRR